MSRLSETPPEKPPQNPTTHASAPVHPYPEFPLDQRRTLLRIAREAILSHLGHPVPAHAEPLPPEFSEPRGVFTTLYLPSNSPGDLPGEANRQLRGCVGYALPVEPLYRAVAETARAAAFEDSRFEPVTRAEALKLLVSLSILSPLSPISPEAVEVGRHGLFISDGSRRGLLLPQVAVEHGWDREEFLRQTCRKAGLPPDAWHNSATVTIRAFTAEGFADFDLDFGKDQR